MEFVVNANYRGKLKQTINLESLNVPNSKYHMRPHQLVIKDVKGTVILFSSGSVRAMGCADAIKAAFLLYSCIEKIDDDDIPELYCQSYTSRTKLSRKLTCLNCVSVMIHFMNLNCLLLCV